MPSITKLWHFSVKSPETIQDPDFEQLWRDVLEFCESYSNPGDDPKQEPMHFLYKSIEDPKSLVMISGYPSLEMNLEADKQYADRFLAKMFEYVEHRSLWQLDVDIRNMPAGKERILVRSVKKELHDAPGVGGWDHWQPNSGSGESTVESEKARDWIQVSDGAMFAADISQMDGTHFVLQKFMPR